MREIHIGDVVWLHGQYRTTVVGFSEDHGTRLSNGDWICATELLPYEGGSWVHKSSSGVRDAHYDRREGR